MSHPDSLPAALQLDLFGTAASAAPLLKVPAVASPAPSAPRPLPIRPVAEVPQKQAHPLRPSSKPPAPSGTQQPKRCLQVGSQALEYTLRRSPRRTIGFLINDEGLRVTAPKWTTVAEIERAIHEKQRWILSKLQLRRERAVHQLQQKMQWGDGALVPYLGIELTLRLSAAMTAANPAAIAYNEISRELTVALPEHATEQHLKDSVQGWLQLQAKRLFAQRLPHYAGQLGVSYQSFALSSATTQWGSCTSRGKIRLNWRLIHFTLPLIDYVIAHELSHLREMNHSPRFWATVHSVFPDYPMARKTLRELGQKMLQLF